jgi:oxygen-independent coproporphyrinogen-3 oxidase
MTARLRRGEFQAIDEDAEAAMYEHTVERLGAEGFERYEVSNFARRAPDGTLRASAHNLAYWRCDPWLAAGPSASAHVAGHRWKNVPRLTEWMDGVANNAGASPIIDHETPDARRALAERLMMSLRIAEGVDEAEVMRRAESIGRADALASEIESHIRRAMIQRADGRIRLTREGFLFADGTASRLMQALGD